MIDSRVLTNFQTPMSLVPPLALKDHLHLHQLTEAHKMVMEVRTSAQFLPEARIVVMDFLRTPTHTAHHQIIGILCQHTRRTSYTKHTALKKNMVNSESLLVTISQNPVIRSMIRITMIMEQCNRVLRMYRNLLLGRDIQIIETA